MPTTDFNLYIIVLTQDLRITDLRILKELRQQYRHFKYFQRLRERRPQIYVFFVGTVKPKIISSTLRIACIQ